MSQGSDIAAALAPAAAAASDAIDRERQLTDAVVAELCEAGVFRALVPHSLGGLELGLRDFADLARGLAEADASTAWCATQGAVIAMVSAWLAPEVGQAMWRSPTAAVANGPPLDCVARPTGSGYLLDGRWGFSSGCQHATWMVGAAPVQDTKRWIMAVVPKSRVSFHDNWQVPGLRGTGSFEFSMAELEVAEGWVANMAEPPQHPGVVYKVPMGLVFAVGFASVALGVARAGLDLVLQLAADKVPGYSRQVLKDSALVQDQLGESEARWRGAHAYLGATVDAVISDASDSLDADARIALRMAGTHVMREAADCLRSAYELAGSSGIYQDNPLQRRFQDMHVITQHVQARRSHYGFVGRHLLGFPFAPGPLN